MDQIIDMEKSNKILEMQWTHLEHYTFTSTLHKIGEIGLNPNWHDVTLPLNYSENRQFEETLNLKGVFKFLWITTIRPRQLEDNIKNEEDPWNEDNPKNKDNPKNEDT